jgi:hypothetical protein
MRAGPGGIAICCLHGQKLALEAAGWDAFAAGAPGSWDWRALAADPESALPDGILAACAGRRVLVVRDGTAGREEGGAMKALARALAIQSKAASVKHLDMAPAARDGT